SSSNSPPPTSWPPPPPTVPFESAVLGRLVLVTSFRLLSSCVTLYLQPMFFASLTRMPPKPYILILDNVDVVPEYLSYILTDEGYIAEMAESAERAIERASQGGLDVVLLDVWLPGIDGLEALSRIQTLAHPPAVIMISGHATIDTAVRATKLGAFDF